MIAIKVKTKRDLKKREKKNCVQTISLIDKGVECHSEMSV